MAQGAYPSWKATRPSPASGPGGRLAVMKAELEAALNSTSESEEDESEEMDDRIRLGLEVDENWPDTKSWVENVYRSEPLEQIQSAENPVD